MQLHWLYIWALLLCLAQKNVVQCLEKEMHLLNVSQLKFPSEKRSKFSENTNVLINKFIYSAAYGRVSCIQTLLDV